MKPKLQILMEGYRLVLPADPTKVDAKPEQSDVHDYGEAIDYVAKNGTRYIAGVDVPVDEDGEESEEIEMMFDHWLYVATPVDVEIDDKVVEEPVHHSHEEKAQRMVSKELEKILRSSEMAPRPQVNEPEPMKQPTSVKGEKKQ